MSTSTGNSTKESPEILTCKAEEWSLGLGMGVCAVVMLFGSLGNLLTIATLVHQSLMKKSHRIIKKWKPDYILIFNLAIADFLYSSVSLPVMFFTYYKIFNNPDNQDIHMGICTWSAFLRYVNAFVEWSTLAIMALERCITICHFKNMVRYKSVLFSCKKTVCYCVATWVVGGLSQLAPVIQDNGFAYVGKTCKCDFTDDIHRTIFFAVLTFVPCVIIITCYIIILIINHNNFTNIFHSMPSMSRDLAMTRRSHNTVIIARLLVVYIVCVVPMAIHNLVELSIDKVGSSLQTAGIILYCIYWLQYCLNTIIYVFSNKKFRQAYGQFFRLITCRPITKLVSIVRTVPEDNAADEGNNNRSILERVAGQDRVLTVSMMVEPGSTIDNASCDQFPETNNENLNDEPDKGLDNIAYEPSPTDPGSSHGAPPTRHR